MSARSALAPLALASAGLVVAVVLGGCESSQSKNERLARETKAVVNQKGLRVKRRNPDVEVVRTGVVQDENGAAAAVWLRNRSGRDLAALPVSIDVQDRRGKSLFRNDEAGLEPALVEVSYLPARESIVWVHDQVDVFERPSRVVARVGLERGKAPRAAPRVETGRAHYELDPDGVLARGKVKNDSPLLQRKLVIFGVALRGRRIVAAGRAQVNRLNARKGAEFEMFFIGNPRRGQLLLAAPPTTLE